MGEEARLNRNLADLTKWRRCNIFMRSHISALVEASLLPGATGDHGKFSDGEDRKEAHRWR